MAYVNSRDTALGLIEEGLVDANDMLQACLMYMSCDDVTEMLYANEFLTVPEEEENPIREHYDACMCPDCGEDIPLDAAEGGQCENCGHVWCGISADDATEGADDSIEP